MVLGESYNLGGVIREFKIVLFHLLAGQYHTNRLAAVPSYVALVIQVQKIRRIKKPRGFLWASYSEDQYGTGPSILSYRVFVAVIDSLSYECKSIGDISLNILLR